MKASQVVIQTIDVYPFHPDGDFLHWPRFGPKIQVLPFIRGASMSQLYDMEMDGITGESVSLSEYRDQALLIVNLASQ